jgi:tellurite resistance protein
VLASAIEDGHVDEHETKRLESICEWIGIPVGGMIRRFFLEEGEGFLRGVFLSSIEDGNLIEEEWARLLECAGRLGLTNDELLASIESHATRFLEHVLADAKADGRLSQAEDRNVSWLLRTFRLPTQQRTYFESELAEMRIYTGIEEGRLPSIPPPPDTGIRAGEIIHHWGPATYHLIRQRKSGPVVEVFDGQVTVTDNRLIFSSALKSTTLNYRSVVECRQRSKGVELRSASKGGGLYDFKGLFRQIRG